MAVSFSMVSGYSFLFFEEFNALLDGPSEALHLLEAARELVGDGPEEVLVRQLAILEAPVHPARRVALVGEHLHDAVYLLRADPRGLIRNRLGPLRAEQRDRRGLRGLLVLFSSYFFFLGRGRRVAARRAVRARLQAELSVSDLLRGLCRFLCNSLLTSSSRTSLISIIGQTSLLGNIGLTRALTNTGHASLLGTTGQ